VNTILRSLCTTVLALGLLASGCKPHATPVTRGNRDGVLYRGSGTEPESLDPHVIRGVTEWVIAAALYEGLAVPSPETGKPAPGVASSWETTPDGLVYMFHLRPEAKWSDGSPLTAADFAYSMHRMLMPAMGSAHAEDTLLFIRNARAFQNGTITDFGEVGVKVVDAHTLEIALENPTPFFPEALYQFYPVKQDVVEKYGAMTDRAAAWAKPDRIVTNGPFALRSWRSGQDLIVAKNPFYWDAEHVRLNEVHFLPYENPSTEEAAFRSGQIHLTFGIPLQKIAAYQKDKPDQLKTAPDFGVYFYAVNVAHPPLNDVRVRQALALAIDRESLAHRILGGGREPAAAFTPKDLGSYLTPEGLVRFDPARARQLLAEAGFPDGRGFPPLEILIDSRDPHRLVGETIQQMWQEHLGITIKLRSEETRTLIANKRLFDFDFVRGSWNATSYRDPHFFLSSWQTGNLYNEAGWSDAQFDSLVQQAIHSADPVRRLALFREAETRFLNEMPAIPLFYSSEIFLMAPSVHGWSGRPFADRLFKSLWVE